VATATNFGRDISCTDGLRTGRYARGVTLVGESYYRRLTTPRGALRGGEEEENFGLDLVAKIGSLANASTRAALPGQISSELMKDERSLTIDAAVVESTTPDGVGPKWIVTVFAETTEGPFTLQIGISDVSAELLGIEET
jgi:hypothetical protein